MTTTAREDAHRVAVLDPADYDLAAFEDMHPEEGMIDVVGAGTEYTYVEFRVIDGCRVPTGRAAYYTESDLFASLMDRVENPTYGCRLCGQAHGNRYWYYFEHLPTGDVIRVGSQCAAACHLASREQLEDRRSYERRDMAVERGRRLAGDPACRWALEWCWRTVGEDAEAGATGGLIVTPDLDGATSFARGFARDALVRFNREATFSDKQVALCRKLHAEADEKRERVERIEREKAEAQPIPAEVAEAKRATITGEIVSGRWRESDFGESYKIIVRDDRGFRVWGTAAEALWQDGELPNGTRVTFDAAVAVSDDDPTFGFFKRPTKAARVGESVQAEEAPVSLLADLEGGG